MVDRNTELFQLRAVPIGRTKTDHFVVDPARPRNQPEQHRFGAARPKAADDMKDSEPGPCRPDLMKSLRRPFYRPNPCSLTPEAADIDVFVTDVENGATVLVASEGSLSR